MWYVSSLYLQQVLGLSPLATGFAFLPMALVILLCASQAGKLVGRFGVRAVLGSGLVIMASGMLLFARIGAERERRGLHRAAGHPHRHRHRAVDRAFHDLCHPGRGACSGGAGFRAGQHFPPGRRWPGPGLLISLATGYTSGAIGRNVAVPLALTNGFRLAYLIAAGFVVAAAALVTFTFVRAPP